MNEQQNIIEKATSAPEKKSFLERHHLAIKACVIAILTLLLLIPQSMVDGLIYERSEKSEELGLELRVKWGGSKTIIGPILSLSNNTKLFDSASVQVLPKELKITSNLQTQTLKRGMYDATVYTTEVTMSGSFELPEALLKDNKLVLNGPAFINIGFSDFNGLSSQKLKWGGDNCKLTSGVKHCNVILSGINAPISLASFAEHNNKVEFEIKLQFNGSSFIEFAPLGEQTTVDITSNYFTPSFDGAFLPQDRQVSQTGFSAHWSIMSINRHYPQMFTENYEYQIDDSKFGVTLKVPVEQYQQVTRTVKYAFLIIVLTFVLSFFVEIIQKRNIHPFQYLLIGLTLCLFYTLLLSISEHLGFDWAYLIASVMTVLLITFYMYGIIKVKKTALTIGTVLSSLYIYIYVMIQMETFALLTGSVGLFMIMAAIMYFSLRIKWNGK